MDRIKFDNEIMTDPVRKEGNQRRHYKAIQ